MWAVTFSVLCWLCRPARGQCYPVTGSGYDDRVFPAVAANGVTITPDCQAGKAGNPCYMSCSVDTWYGGWSACHLPGRECYDVKCAGAPVVEHGSSPASCSNADYGETCTVQCDPCYSGGSGVFTCSQASSTQVAGVWVGPSLTCSEITCNNPGGGASLTNSCGSSSNCGDDCVVSCNTCYGGSSAVTRTCGASGWTSSNPTCTRKTCPAFAATPGRSGCTITDCGNTCTLTCDSCYRSTGAPYSQTLTCQDNGWEATSLACEVYTCPAIPATSAFSGCPNSICGESCVQACTTCYAGVSVTRTCGPSGWSASNPNCAERTCPALTGGTGVAIVCNGATVCGKVCTASCLECYSPVSTVSRTCQSSGAWSSANPTCSLRTCAAVTLGVGMSNSCGAGSTNCDGTCTISCTSCYAGTATTRRCKSDGTWGGDNPICGVRTCAPLVVSGEQETACVGSQVCGTTCTVRCLTCYTPNSFVSRTCQPDGTWSGANPTCTMRTCGAVAASTQRSGCAVTDCGGACTMACESCYSGSSVSRTCTPSGWDSTALPSCTERTCLAISRVSGQTDSCPGTGARACGTECNVTCGACYSQEGGTFPRTCGPLGIFSGDSPMCTIKTCAPLSLTTGQTSTCAGTQTCGTTCTVECTACYSPNTPVVRTCQSDGTWAGTSPTCSLRTCASLPSAIGYDGCAETSCGDTCSSACTSCYAGSAVGRSCTPSGWDVSAPPTCALRECTALTLTEGMVGNCSGSVHTCGAACDLQCDQCYTRTGGVVPRTCRRDGGWTGSSPACALRYCVDPDTTLYAGCGAAACGGTCTLVCHAGLSGVPVARECLRDGWNTSTVPYCFGESASVAALNGSSRPIVLTTSDVVGAVFPLSSTVANLTAGVDLYAIVPHGADCSIATPVTTGGAGDTPTIFLDALASVPFQDYDLCYDYRGISGLTLQIAASPWLRVMDSGDLIHRIDGSPALLEGVLTAIRAMAAAPLESDTITLSPLNDKYEFVVSGTACSSGPTAGTPCQSFPGDAVPYVVVAGASALVQYDFCFNAGGYAGLTKQTAAVPWVSVLDAPTVVATVLRSTTVIVMAREDLVAHRGVPITSLSGTLLPGVDTYAIVPSGSSCFAASPVATYAVNNQTMINVTGVENGRFDLCYSFGGTVALSRQTQATPWLIITDVFTAVTSVGGFRRTLEVEASVAASMTAVMLSSVSTFLTISDKYEFVPHGSACGDVSNASQVAPRGASVTVSIAALAPGDYDLCYSLTGVPLARQSIAAPWIRILSASTVITSVDGWAVPFWMYLSEARARKTVVVASTIAALTEEFDRYAWITHGSACPGGPTAGTELGLGETVSIAAFTPGEYDLCFNFHGNSGLSVQTGAGTPYVTVIEDACAPFDAPPFGALGSCADVVADPCVAWNSTARTSCGPSVKDGSNCSFVCDLGYTLSTSHGKCSAGVWTTVQECLADPCFLPADEVVIDGTIGSCAMVPSDNNCSVVCNPGYGTVGRPRRCFLGEWLDPMQTCYAVECAALSPPSNGYTVCEHLGNFYTPDNLTVGCSSFCNAGYARAQGLEFLRCLANGKWSGPALSCTSECGGSCPARQVCVDNNCVCGGGYGGAVPACLPVCANCRASDFKECLAPGVCTCAAGYVWSDAQVCEPVCTTCRAGIEACTGPERCSLLSSLRCGDNIFTPEIGEECDGSAVCTTGCECDPIGWAFNATRGTCIPLPSERFSLLVRSRLPSELQDWLASILSILLEEPVPPRLVNYSFVTGNARRRAEFENFHIDTIILASLDPFISGKYLQSLLTGALFRGDERLAFDEDHAFGHLVNGIVVAGYSANGDPIVLGQCRVSLTGLVDVPLRVDAGKGTDVLQGTGTRLYESRELYNGVPMKAPSGAEAYDPVPRFWSVGNAKITRLPVWTTNKEIKLSLTYVDGGPVELVGRFGDAPDFMLEMDASSLQQGEENPAGWDCTFSLKMDERMAADAPGAPAGTYPGYDFKMRAYVPPGTDEDPVTTLTLPLERNNTWLYVLVVQGEGRHVTGFANADVTDSGFVLTNASVLRYDATSEFKLLAEYDDPTSVILDTLIFLPILLFILFTCVVACKWPRRFHWLKGHMWRPSGHEKTVYNVHVSTIMERNQEQFVRRRKINQSKDAVGVSVQPLYTEALARIEEWMEEDQHRPFLPLPVESKQMHAADYVELLQDIIEGEEEIGTVALIDPVDIDVTLRDIMTSSPPHDPLRGGEGIPHKFAAFLNDSNVRVETWADTLRDTLFEQPAMVEARLPESHTVFQRARAALYLMGRSYADTQDMFSNLLVYLSTRVANRGGIPEANETDLPLELVAFVLTNAANTFYLSIREPMARARLITSQALTSRLLTVKQADTILLQYYRLVQFMILMHKKLQHSLYSLVMVNSPSDDDDEEVNKAKQGLALDDTEQRLASTINIHSSVKQLSAVQRQHVQEYLARAVRTKNLKLDDAVDAGDSILGILAQMTAADVAHARRFIFSIMTAEQLRFAGFTRDGHMFEKLGRAGEERHAVTSVITTTLSQLGQGFHGGFDLHAAYLENLHSIAKAVRDHKPSKHGTREYLAIEVERLTRTLYDVHVPELRLSLSFAAQHLAEFCTPDLLRLLGAHARECVSAGAVVVINAVVNVFREVTTSAASLDDLADDAATFTRAVAALDAVTQFSLDVLEAEVLSSEPARFLPTAISQACVAKGLEKDPGMAMRLRELAALSQELRVSCYTFGRELKEIKNQAYKAFSKNKIKFKSNIVLSADTEAHDAIYLGADRLVHVLAAAKARCRIEINPPSASIASTKSYQKAPFDRVKVSDVLASAAIEMRRCNPEPLTVSVTEKTSGEALRVAKTVGLPDVSVRDMPFTPSAGARARSARKCLAKGGLICVSVLTAVVIALFTLLRAFLDIKFLHLSASESVPGFESTTPWSRVDEDMETSALADVPLFLLFFRSATTTLEFVYNSLDAIKSFADTTTFNCGGVIFALSPVFFVLVSTATFFLVKKDFLLFVGIGLRNKTVGFGRVKRTFLRGCADLVTAILLYMLQLTIHAASLVLASGVLGFRRTCDDVDRIFTENVGRPFAVFMLVVMYMFNFFLFAGPPAGNPSWKFIDNHAYHNRKLPCFAKPFFVAWLFVDAFKRHILGIFGLWTKDMVLAHRIHYRAGVNDADPDDDDNLQEHVIILVSKSGGLFWLFFPLGTWITKLSEAINAFPIFTHGATAKDNFLCCNSHQNEGPAMSDEMSFLEASDEDDSATEFQEEESVMEAPPEVVAEAGGPVYSRDSASLDTSRTMGSTRAPPSTHVPRAATAVDRPASEGSSLTESASYDLNNDEMKGEGDEWYDPSGLQLKTGRRKRIAMWFVNFIKFMVILCIVLGFGRVWFSLLGVVAFVQVVVLSIGSITERVDGWDKMRE